MSDWKAAIRAHVAQDPRGIAGVASRIGIKRSALSMLLSGTYPADPSRQLTRVLLWLGQGSLECPHLAITLAEDECRAYRSRPQPSGDAAKLRHWIACQDCPLGLALLTRAAQQPQPENPSSSPAEKESAHVA